MNEKLEYYFNFWGFKTLMTNTLGFTLYFKIENHYINAVHVVDMKRNSDITKEFLERATEKISWKFIDGGSADVHILTLILTEDLYSARLLGQDNPFCWIIQQQEERLYIEDGKIEDFYGLKNMLTQSLELPYQPDQVRERSLEYNTSGRQVYRSIWDRPIVNHAIFIINALVFTACVLTGELLYDLGMMSVPLVLKDGQWYRIFTSMFLHANMSHLVGNMMILYFLGDMVERALGHVKYLFLYLIAGIGAAAASLWFEMITQNYAGSLGASGAIFGMIGALLWITLRNHGRLETVTVPKVIFLISYSIYRGFIGTNIDNAAHIGGLLTGFLLAILLYRSKKHRMKERKFHEN